MKATAKAPANVAFIKYWGKVDEKMRIPANDSLSMNLSSAYTTTTVEFSSAHIQDSIYFLTDGFDKIMHMQNFVKISSIERRRIVEHLDRIRVRCGITMKAKVVTSNSFPKGAGAASSASGFAALTVAGFAAAGIQLSEKELTIFARLGSGSACRSIPDGFVVWKKGSSSDSSYAYSLCLHTYWDLRDVLVIVDSGMKKVSTTEGHGGVKTSPYWKNRITAIPQRMERLTKALKEKNLKELGEVIEEDCLDMHHVMQTQDPPLLYWNETTNVIMDTVRDGRANGLPVYFTIDAGPNVHLICEGKNELKVMEAVKTIEGIQEVIINKPAAGAHLLETHLF